MLAVVLIVLVPVPSPLAAVAVRGASVLSIVLSTWKDTKTGVEVRGRFL